MADVVEQLYQMYVLILVFVDFLMNTFTFLIIVDMISVLIIVFVDFLMNQ